MLGSRSQGAGTGLLVMDGPVAPEAERRGIRLRPSPGAAPLPVREPLGVRAIHLDAARAGADVITAATADLYRRALSRRGDARRAREWTSLAVRLALEAVSIAREDESSGAAHTGESPRRLRVAGLLSPLEDAAVPEYAPDAAAAAEEHRAQAALLADSGAEMVRITSMGTLRESEAATAASVEMGLETWSGIRLADDGLSLAGGEPMEAWLETLEPLRPAALLIEGRSFDAISRAVAFLAPRTRARVGVELPPGIADAGPGGVIPGAEQATSDGEGNSGPTAVQATSDGAEDPGTGAEGRVPEMPPDPMYEAVARLADAGATIFGPGEDGGPARIAALRRSVDAAAASHGRQRTSRRSAWIAWLAEGIQRGPAGPTLWLTDNGPAEAAGAGAGTADVEAAAEAVEGAAEAVEAAAELPPATRRDWERTTLADSSQLPGQRYQLIVALLGRAPGQAMRGLVDLLAEGGWLLVATSPDCVAALRADDRLEKLAPTEKPAPGFGEGWIARRRP